MRASSWYQVVGASDLDHSKIGFLKYFWLPVKAGLKSIVFFHTEDGKCPFEEWFNSLKDQRAKGKIQSRLLGLKHGNPGKHRNLAGGIVEAKIDYGPGYRIYFGEKEGKTVILLLGGDKTDQNQDIRKAQAYWASIKGGVWQTVVRTLTLGYLGR